jgi:hypothetical protein
LPAADTGSTRHRQPLPVGTSKHANTCAPGYAPVFQADSDATTNVDCYALCSPGDSYLGATVQHPNGLSPHACNSTDAVGNFGAIPDGSPTSNGEHCEYAWRFEVDAADRLHRSDTSDTVGICFDHSKYHYDSNGNGTIDPDDAELPPCAALPLTSDVLSAADLGCVSSTLAGVMRAPHRLIGRL